MKNNVSLIYNFFLVFGDFLALVAAFGGAYILRVSLDHRPLQFTIHAKAYITVFLVLLPFWILIFALLGLYNASIYEKRFNELGRLFVGSFIGMLFVVFWNFLSKTPILPARLVPIYGFILAFVFLVIFRNLARLIRTILFSFERGLTNVLIIGNTNLSQELVKNLSDSPRSGYRVLGLVGHGNYGQVKTFSDFASARKSLKNNLHSIIQTELYADEAKNQEILTFAQTNHIGYRFSPGDSELFVGKLEVELFRSAIPIITVHQTALLGWGQVVKRIFDLLVCMPLLIFATPLMLVISFINLLLYGSVFFRQTRLTRYNQKFKAYKFQTAKNKFNNLTPEEAFIKMGKPELIQEYRANGNKIANDPRYGKFGRFLRKTSLDELPQLLNILKGNLSLVGPRALVPEEISLYEKRHAILSVKSGLTGLAQVSGRGNINFDERGQLDMFYVQNWSFWLDLTIIAKTVKAVLTGAGSR